MVLIIFFGKNLIIVGIDGILCFMTIFTYMRLLYTYHRNIEPITIKYFSKVVDYKLVLTIVYIIVLLLVYAMTSWLNPAIIWIMFLLIVTLFYCNLMYSFLNLDRRFNGPYPVINGSLVEYNSINCRGISFKNALRLRRLYDSGTFWLNFDGTYQNEYINFLVSGGHYFSSYSLPTDDYALIWIDMMLGYDECSYKSLRDSTAYAMFYWRTVLTRDEYIKFISVIRGHSGKHVKSYIYGLEFGDWSK